MKDYKGFRIYKIVSYEIRDNQDIGIDTLNSLEEAKERIRELKRNELPKEAKKE